MWIPRDRGRRIDDELEGDPTGGLRGGRGVVEGAGRLIRIGSGFDVHGFDASRPLILGGVTIPDHPGLGGHSDADVVSHAVGDSLLGAVRLGDLGSLFPGTEKWQDASSLGILTE